jgi:Family of unknown function (DUF6600)/FecR protein
MLKRLRAIELLTVAVLVCLLSLPAFADSHARVVRLSSVEGKVEVDRGQGFERAFLNMPITQGSKLRTGEGGRAEVEFEDNSTVRIVPNSEISFPQLSLRDSGSKVSTISLVQGKAYVDFRGAKEPGFTLNFGREETALTKPAHLRIEMLDAESTLAVFKGNVSVEGPSGTVDVNQKHTVTYNLADNDKYKLASNIEEDPYDAWDKEQGQYHDRYTEVASNSYSPYAYGMNDLGYYGNFFGLPGYGMVWQPYFTSAAWNPFMDGAWLWYPGYGYDWVSAYPWGWTPYHYGSWIFAPGYGWVWQPGGSWAGWYSVPNVVNPPKTFNPPRPPSGTSTVVVNRGTVLPGSGKVSSKLMVRNDSAGLGIPRGSISNLAKLNQRVAQRGPVAVRVPTFTPAPTFRPLSPVGRSFGHAPLSTRAPMTPRMSMPAPHSASPAVHSSGSPSRH